MDGCKVGGPAGDDELTHKLRRNGALFGDADKYPIPDFCSMTESGVEFLDEIGLVLNLFVLMFVILFHVVPFNTRQAILAWLDARVASFRSMVTAHEAPPEAAKKREKKPAPMTWERRVGAWLVIWLLAYMIHLQMTFYDSLDWLRYEWDGSAASTSIYKMESVMSWFNFIFICTLLMLLIPIPILRRTWMVPLFAAMAIGARMIDSWGIDNGWNLNLAILFVMLIAMTNIIMSLRTMFFLPERSDRSPEALALRRSGYFALGATVILSDFMVFLVPGFLSGKASSWWYGNFMNWSVVFHGHGGLLTTHVLTSIIMGAFSLFMVGLGIGAIYHFVQVRKKRRDFGVVGIFSMYYLFMWALILIRFVANETDFAPFANMSGRPMEAGVYDYGTVYTVTEEQMSRAVLIDALTRGFTEHLVYPIIALLHAVKFGLIRIETDLEKKALRGLALVLLLAMAAVFTEVLQEVLNMVGLPNNDIIFAIICGPVLATGWERLLIDAMLPEKETLTITWKFPGNETVLVWTVNLLVGGAFLFQVVVGVFSPVTWGAVAGVFFLSALVLALAREIPRRVWS